MQQPLLYSLFAISSSGEDAGVNMLLSRKVGIVSLSPQRKRDRVDLHASVFLALFFAAIGIGGFASFLGLGGGVFMVPLLFLGGFVATMPEAVGTSIAGVIFTSLSSSIAYALKRKINIKLGLLLMPTTMFGAWCGARERQREGDAGRGKDKEKATRRKGDAGRMQKPRVPASPCPGIPVSQRPRMISVFSVKLIPIDSSSARTGL